MATHIDTASARPAQRENSPNTDPHLAWWAEAEQARIALDEGRYATEAEGDALFRRLEHFRDLFASTPAHTAAGALTQLRHLADWLPASQPGEGELAALRSAIATLEAMAHVTASTAADPHPAWLAQANDLSARINGTRGEARQDRLGAERDALIDRIIATPASSGAGALALARIVAAYFADDRATEPARASRALVASLELLAREG